MPRRNAAIVDRRRPGAPGERSHGFLEAPGRLELTTASAAGASWAPRSAATVVPSRRLRGSKRDRLGSTGPPRRFGKRWLRFPEAPGRLGERSHGFLEAPGRLQRTKISLRATSQVSKAATVRIGHSIRRSCDTSCPINLPTEVRNRGNHPPMRGRVRCRSKQNDSPVAPTTASLLKPSLAAVSAAAPAPLMFHAPATDLGHEKGGNLSPLYCKWILTVTVRNHEKHCPSRRKIGNSRRRYSLP